jgi:hypothetical protein
MWQSARACRRNERRRASAPCDAIIGIGGSISEAQILRERVVGDLPVHGVEDSVMSRCPVRPDILVSLLFATAQWPDVCNNGE